MSLALNLSTCRALKPLRDWEPTTAEHVACEYVRLMLDEASRALSRPVTEDELCAARRRVAWDSYYGPVADDEWEAADGSRMPLKLALRLVRAALRASAPEATFVNPEHPLEEVEEDGEALPNATAGGDALRADAWGFVKEIYGRLDL